MSQIGTIAAAILMLMPLVVQAGVLGEVGKLARKAEPTFRKVRGLPAGFEVEARGVSVTPELGGGTVYKVRREAADGTIKTSVLRKDSEDVVDFISFDGTPSYGVTRLGPNSYKFEIKIPASELSAQLKLEHGFKLINVTEADVSGRVVLDLERMGVPYTKTIYLSKAENGKETPELVVNLRSFSDPVVISLPQNSSVRGSAVR